MKMIFKCVILWAAFSGMSVVAKPFLEFKQAVARYTNHIEHHYLTLVSRNSDENIAYKKELRYLFKNYGRFSVNALLSRLRSAHQEMVKQEINKESETYQRYEQISSALLLVCSLIFFNELRSQILSALSEIDYLLMYWRYQYTHQISYFFSKSPLKWIIGKKQEQEIIHNILNLEQKQKELCILLGSLTEHVHLFNDVNTTYADCYTWVEKLVELCACIKTKSRYNDGSRFDVVATQLELKLKKIDEFANGCISSIKMTKKPGHFTRNWIRYAVGAAAVGYMAHYYVLNSESVNQMIEDRLSSAGESWTGFVVKPSNDLWQTIFGKVETPDLGDAANKSASVDELMKSIQDLEGKRVENKQRSEDLKTYLKTDIANTQEKMRSLLNLWRDENKINQEEYDKMINAEAAGNIAPFQKFVLDMPAYLVGNLIQRDDLIRAIVVLAELMIYHYGSSLIEVVFELIVDFGIPVVKEVLIVLAKGNKEWESVYKKVNLILNVAVLTPTIIIGLVGCNGLYRTYKHMTKRNYSPIRIALADVNSLLIESGNELDNHQYGKLLYLIYKLRDTTTQLKDSLAHEFLWDISKLESKQYSAQIKHDLIENMFHKYPFLGTIIV